MKPSTSGSGRTRKAAGAWLHFRGSRKQRRKRYAAEDSRGRLAGKKMIGERPAAVGGRTRIGDWEIDTVHGKGKAGVVTVVERHSGLTRIGKIARVTMGDTSRRTIKLLCRERHKVATITADNGSGFHGYKHLERLWRRKFISPRRTTRGSAGPTGTPTG